jgi:transposase
MMELIKSSENLKEKYLPVTSVKGIAMINTVAIPAATQNFTCFANSRQLACYAGPAPFGSQSGTSINVAPHVSHPADKKIKVLLTRAALCAIRHNTNIGRYYRRKKTEGKNDRLTVNNIRNKLVHRIFAIIRTGNFYQVDFKKTLDKKNA